MARVPAELAPLACLAKIESSSALGGLELAGVSSPRIEIATPSNQSKGVSAPPPRPSTRRSGINTVTDDSNRVQPEDGAGETRSVFIAHHKDKQLIPGLTAGVGAILVHRWDEKHKRARNWALYGADLTMDFGHPFGTLWYRHNDDRRTIRIGVRWNTEIEMLECVHLHPTEPRPADEPDDDADAVLLDARSRLGALQAIHAQVGVFASTRVSEDAILAAAGFGLRRIEDDKAPQ